MKKLLLLIVGFLILVPRQAKAVVDPLGSPNNIFGIHISNESDLELAAQLVNSTGGEWGYVTMVIREDERNLERFQEKFNQLRKHKLIPIVRIATTIEGDNWKTPEFDQINQWVDFLDSLNWVTKNRYIVLFNEPNHAKEWGGTIDPQGYAKLVTDFQYALKQKNEDFYVMAAALDLAAENTNSTMHPADFWQGMYDQNQHIFELFDGWNSHSYPNPGFVGSAYQTGRMSIQGYKYELDQVSKLGFDKNKPVFITETGWLTNYNSRLLPLYYQYAFEKVWSDPQIVAVTPFIIDYRFKPFENFSWVSPQTNLPLPHFQTVQKLAKIKGEPVIDRGSKLAKRFFPSVVQTNRNLAVAIRFINTGQDIWLPETHQLSITSTLDPNNVLASPVSETMPGHEAKIWVYLSSSDVSDQQSIVFSLSRNGEKFGEEVTYRFRTQSMLDPISRLRQFFDSMINADDLSL